MKRRGGGADLTKIQPAGIRTKSGGARSIEDGKGPAGSGLSLGVAGVENGGRKDATFLRPPWRMMRIERPMKSKQVVCLIRSPPREQLRHAHAAALTPALTGGFHGDVPPQIPL